MHSILSNNFYQKNSGIILSIIRFVDVEYIKYRMKKLEYKIHSKAGAKSVRLNQTEKEDTFFSEKIVLL